MRKKLLFFILFVLMITGIAVGIHDYFHWQVMLATETFTESTEKIWNPNRGFYHIYGFLISDEPADMSEQLDRQMQKDTDHALAMAQINLREYRDKEISKEGLQNIERLFQAMSVTKEHWIVRFLYDWNGENEKYEPESIDFVIKHMQQVGGILTESKVSSEIVKFLVIGIGINTEKMNFTDDIKNIATSIKKEFGIEVDRKKIITNFCEEFEKTLIRRIKK